MTGALMTTRAQDAPAPVETSQDVHVTVHMGIKGGASLMQLYGANFQSGFRTGFDAGAFAEINITPKWGVQPEIMFNQTSYMTGGQFSNIYPDGVNNYKGQMSYVTIPILFTYTPAKWLSLQAGPQYGILVSNDRKVVQNTQPPFKNGNASLVIGTQFNMSRFKLGARYVVGLTDLNGLYKTTEYDLAEWSLSGFQFYLGFRIF